MNNDAIMYQQVAHTMFPSSLILTGRGTSRAPRNSQSTWGTRPQLRLSSRPWRGCGRTDGRRCGTRPDSGTEWSPYLQPEPQAAVPGLRWLAKRRQPLFQAEFHISAWSRTWRSTTLPLQNRFSTTWIHYHLLLRILSIIGYPRGPA